VYTAAVFPTADEVLRASKGTLASAPFPLLLYALLRAERTCVLELSMRQLQKQVFFEEGVPVACFSNLVHESLGHALVERGKLTEAQHLSAQSESALAGAPLADVLVRRQLVAPFDLFKQMQANLGRQLLDCFRWGDASYHLLPVEHPAESPIRMNSPQLIFTGSTTLLPFETVAAQLVFTEHQRFALTPGADPGELKLSPKDTRFLQALRSNPTFAELQERGGFDVEAALRRLYALGVLGHIHVAEERSALAEGAPPVPGAQPPQAAAPASAPVSASPLAPAATSAKQTGTEAPEPTAAHGLPPFVYADDAESERDALIAEFLNHRNKDAFDVLGLSSAALPAAMRRAFLARADRFSPVRFRSPELKEKAEVLLAVYARAWGELSDSERLEQLRKRRQAATTRSSSAPPRPSAESQFRIKTTLLDAAAQFAEGLKWLHAEQWRQAMDYFEYAFNIEPKAKYRAHLAFARFRLNPNANARLALHELLEAQRSEPGCPEAFGLAADVHRATGEFDRAEAAYRSAQRLDPGERRYAAALRELPRRRP
jgi:cytochrome c-type biogenesis protein CcmH/NrfG